MSMKRIRNTTDSAVRMNISERNEQGRIAKAQFVTFVPRSVVADEKLGPGVVNVPSEVWNEIKKDHRIERRIEAGELVAL